MSLLRPIEGKISQAFDGAFGWEPAGYLATSPKRGKRTKFSGGASRSHLHLAIDYIAPIGTPIRAVKSGTIVAQGTEPTYGEVYLFLRVRNGTTYQVLAFYTHLKKGSFRYAVGAKVKQGAVIALSGDTGMVSGPHLHFEIRRGQRGLGALTSWGKDWMEYDPQPFIDGAITLRRIAP
jgi:murein DD-endopeptidase MepM/ murein hydrolase activator NlpD